MSKPLPVDFGVWGWDAVAERGANSYYRVEVPIRGLRALGLANTYHDKSRDLEAAAVLWGGTDIALLFAVVPSLKDMIEKTQGFKPLKDEHGVLRIAPTSVYDIDDNLDLVHPLNPAYWRLGTRNWDGTLVKPGQGLSIDVDGQTLDIWRDGEKGKIEGSEEHTFNVLENQEHIKACFDTALACEGITVSTERLAQVYREKGAKNVHVFPNSIIPEDYKYFDLAEPKEVRIFWQGGWSHAPDWFRITEPLAEVLRENPNAKFVIWGWVPPWLKKALPEHQLEVHDWAPYEQYKIIRPNLNIHINLCPLEDNRFNECKSNIKWYEASLGPRPEVTLAANVPPYSDEMEDGNTGLLYSNPTEFKEKLTLLIRNRELRLTLAHRAQEWVLANRHFSKTVPELYRFYQNLRMDKRMKALAI